MSRRNFLHKLSVVTVWVAPVVTVVTLPAHAQTSCSVNSVEGRWEIIEAFPDDSTRRYIIFLQPDGRVTGEGAVFWGRWMFQGENSILFPGNPDVPEEIDITAELDQACEVMRGEFQLFVPPPLDSVTFVGNKLD